MGRIDASTLIGLKTRAFFDEVLRACCRIVASDGSLARVEAMPTAYVIRGYTYTITTSSESYRIWVGVNGPRLFYIAYLSGIDVERAHDVYAFCFGGAAKVGWQVNYENAQDFVSVWATCTTDPLEPLVHMLPNWGWRPVDTLLCEVTEAGMFWATDIAMMAQSMVRTSERHGIACHDSSPAPL